jgi:preprotein translocase SecE subunit
MAEKKKNAGPGPSRSQTTENAKTRSSDKELPVKSSRVTARDDRKEQATKKEQTTKQESKPVRRETRGPSSLETRFRSSRVGRFVLDAYYELRHKVTWPTFEEARNMTVAVILLSAAVGALLGLVDYGLQHLFFLISGR